MSSVPVVDETHGGDDVGVYASGPWSHLFIGTYEQSNIPVAMAFAAKIGMYAEGPKECNSARMSPQSQHLIFLLLIIMFVVFLRSKQ